MRVELERGLHAVMAEALTHGLDVDALLEEQGCVCVSKTVKSDRWQRWQLTDPADETAPYDVRVLR